MHDGKENLDSMKDIVDVCIVGAGLSGAYAAHELLAIGKSVSVLDARNRIGGRLLTAEEQGGGDLGGAWIWPKSEYAMQQFLEKINVKTVPMYLDGETMARTADGQRHVLPSGEAARYAACGGGAVRVRGGAASMVQKLLRDDDDSKKLSILLGMRVVRVEHGGGVIKISFATSESSAYGCETSEIKCRAAILAAPPKVLANTIEFHPPLPRSKVESMIATPTWMEDYGKVSASFPRSWWREFNMSAISIDQIGAVSTWWEACSGDDGDGTSPTLAGFVTANGAKALNKMENAEALHDYVIGTLNNLYGVDAFTMGMHKVKADVTTKGFTGEEGLVVSKGGVTITYKSWLEDPYTKNSGKHIIKDYPREYGDRYLQQNTGSIFFAGTEVAKGSGHMEGAIIAAQRAVSDVTQYLN
mmetsp:Transcript_26799/g.56983  ORF Transcript_26799/g.56983 Transcript_26799/m.56983 type:complete len:415 (+) Transcript_26799:128-1372(+)